MTWRIRDRATFGDLRERGRRVRRGPVTVTWVPAAHDGPPRVAYAVSRKAGGAVARNRIRRRLRAAVAEVVVHPGAYLFGGDAAVATLPWGELRTLVQEAAELVTTGGLRPRPGRRRAAPGTADAEGSRAGAP